MNDHDEIVSAFESYRAGVAQTFAPADTESVFSEVRHRTHRRRTVGAVALLVAASGLLTAGVLYRSSPPTIDQNPPTASQTETIAPESPPASGKPSPEGKGNPPTVARTDLASQVSFLNAQVSDRLRNSTITLPAWPTGSELCPAGSFSFAAGAAPTGTTDVLGRPWTYHVLFTTSRGIYANLTADTGDEMVIPMACGGTEVTYQLLVIRQVHGDLQGVGYIPGIPGFDRFYPYAGGLVVEVVNDQMSTVAEQRRRYNWNGSGFVQTSGPGSFPPNLFPDVRDVDLRNSYFAVTSSDAQPPCGGGLLSFVEGWSGTWYPVTSVELGEISPGLLTEPAEFADQGDALVTVTCKSEGAPAKTWVFKVSAARAVGVLQVGADGVTGVVSHRIVGGIAEITVQTKTGQQIWRYTSDGNTLTRLP
jgi:hypothetical protein